MPLTTNRDVDAAKTKVAHAVNAFELKRSIAESVPQLNCGPGFPDSEGSRESDQQKEAHKSYTR